MEKAHVAADGPICGVRRRPKFLHSFVLRRPNFWAFVHSFALCRLKNWISVGDVITGSPGFFHVRPATPNTLKMEEVSISF